MRNWMNCWQWKTTCCWSLLAIFTAGVASICPQTGPNDYEGQMMPRGTRFEGSLEWLRCPFEQFWQRLASLTSSTNCSQLQNAKYLLYGGARLLSAIWLRSIMPASITWNDFDDFESRWNNENCWVLLSLFQCGTRAGPRPSQLTFFQLRLCTIAKQQHQPLWLLGTLLK